MWRLTKSTLMQVNDNSCAVSWAANCHHATPPFSVLVLSLVTYTVALIQPNSQPTVRAVPEIVNLIYWFRIKSIDSCTWTRMFHYLCETQHDFRTVVVWRWHAAPDCLVYAVVLEKLWLPQRHQGSIPGFTNSGGSFDKGQNYWIFCCNGPIQYQHNCACSLLAHKSGFKYHALWDSLSVPGCTSGHTTVLQSLTFAVSWHTGSESSGNTNQTQWLEQQKLYLRAGVKHFCVNSESSKSKQWWNQSVIVCPSVSQQEVLQCTEKQCRHICYVDVSRKCCQSPQRAVVFLHQLDPLCLMLGCTCTSFSTNNSWHHRMRAVHDYNVPTVHFTGIVDFSQSCRKCVP